MTTQRRAPRRTMTREAWLERGKALYGSDLKTWKFRCVACGNVQSHASVTARNPDIGDTSAWIYFACEGRHTDGIGCDWSLGGLFTIHRCDVTDENGRTTPVFEFADDPWGDWKPFTPSGVPLGKKRPSARRKAKVEVP